MNCINCGKEMAAATAYCEFCGAPQQPRSAENNAQFYTENQFNDYGQSRSGSSGTTGEPPHADQQNGYTYGNYAGGYGGYAPYPQPDETDLPMTVGGWIKTFLIMCIPLINFIMVFVWAFGDGNKSRKNLFRAYLLMVLIMIVLIFVLSLAAGIGAGMSAGMGAGAVQTMGV